jgi:hypothetical protein
MTVNYDELVKSWADANAKLTPQPPATQCRGQPWLWHFPWTSKGAISGISSPMRTVALAFFGAEPMGDLCDLAVSSARRRLHHATYVVA